MPGRQEDDILFRSEEDLLPQDQAECEAWTWTNEESEVLPFHCIMFSTIGETSSYPNCVRKVINSLPTRIVSRNLPLCCSCRYTGAYNSCYSSSYLSVVLSIP